MALCCASLFLSSSFSIIYLHVQWISNSASWAFGVMEARKERAPNMLINSELNKNIPLERKQLIWDSSLMQFWVLEKQCLKGVRRSWCLLIVSIRPSCLFSDRKTLKWINWFNTGLCFMLQINTTEQFGGKKDALFSWWPVVTVPRQTDWILT